MSLPVSLQKRKPSRHWESKGSDIQLDTAYRGNSILRQRILHHGTCEAKRVAALRFRVSLCLCLASREKGGTATNSSARGNKDSGTLFQTDAN